MQVVHTLESGGLYFRHLEGNKVDTHEVIEAYHMR